MAVEILGRRVHHEICPELDRPGEHRGGHGVVDDHPHVRRVRERRDRGQVGDLPGRVGGRLQPQEPRATRAHRRRYGGEVGGVDELDVEPPRQGELRQPLPDPPVQDPRHEHVIAGEQRLEHGGGRGVSGGEQDTPRASLERCEETLGVIIGRVVGPGVRPPRSIGAVGTELVGGRRMDRGHEGPGLRVDFAQRLCGQRLGREWRFQLTQPP